jgi:hypothetical protein
MVMLLNLEFDVRYYGDLYLATTPQGTAPRACVQCGSGRLLFFNHEIMFQS